MLSMSLCLFACDDWTEVEVKEIDHTGGYNTSDANDEYYRNLRDWKATSKDYARPIYFGWFSNWSPSGPVRKGYLASLPDSVDMISLWSSPFGLTEDKIADKENFQKKKGGKLLVCYILHNIGTGITPDHVAEKVKQDNPNASSSELIAMIKKAQDGYWGFTDGKKGSDEHTAAIQKYAQALLDSIRVYDYDGLDIDWEPNIGGDGPGSLKGEQGKYLHVLIEALSKELGPKSKPVDGKYRYLLVDGELTQAHSTSMVYIDYLVSQAYYNYSKYQLDRRVNSCKKHFGEQYDTKKHIFTENFESLSQSGGGLLFQAGYNHDDGPKGGVGAFRLDNDYDNTPDYTWTRQAIQIMHQSHKEYMENKSKNDKKQEKK